MKAVQLRQSILQAAVQGKLLPQNPHDEPAGELLKRIQAAKLKLIKQIRKDKPFPPIEEDEVPYDLPDGWEWCRLGELAFSVDYGTSEKASSNPNGVPILRMNNIQNSKVTLTNLKYIASNVLDLPYLYLHYGELLFNRTNSFELVGKSGVFTGPESKFSFASYLIRVKFAYDPISFWLNLYINSDTCRKTQIEPNATQQNGQANFNGTKLKSIIVPLPPFDEQQRIIAKVDELMALCDELEATEKELDKLETDFAEYLPKSILQAAVQGKLVRQNVHDEPASELLKRIQQEKTRLIKEGKLKKEKPLPPITEDEVPYDLPEGWIWCRLSEIGEIVGGATPLTTESSFYTNPGSGVAWITPADMKSAQNNLISRGNKDVTESGFNSCSTRMLPAGSVIFSSRAPIGLLALAKNSLCTNQGFKSVIPYDMTMNKWIFYTLMEKTEDIISRAPGTTFLEVSGEFMRKEIIPLPPLAEQQRIIAKVDELIALCNELKTVKNTPITSAASNIVSFPVLEEEEEMLAVARGDGARGLSDKAQHDADELFGD